MVLVITIAAVRLILYDALARCVCLFFFFVRIRRPPRSTLDRSPAASDVYKRQDSIRRGLAWLRTNGPELGVRVVSLSVAGDPVEPLVDNPVDAAVAELVAAGMAVSYTHLRAHETVLDIVCRILLEKKKPQPSRQRLTSSEHM